MAVNDTTLYKAELKEFYFKKCKMDKEHNTILLKDIVYNHIKNNVQPENNTLELYDYRKSINGVTIENFAKCKREEVSKSYPDDVEFIFIYDSYEYIVKDMQTRSLIENAILPLGLKWYVRYYHSYSILAIVITWDHWENEIK
jgi:hypothetical protein